MLSSYEKFVFLALARAGEHEDRPRQRASPGLPGCQLAGIGRRVELQVAEHASDKRALTTTSGIARAFASATRFGQISVSISRPRRGLK